MSRPTVEVINPTAIVSVDSDSSIDTSRDPLAPAPRPMIRERHQIMGERAPTGIDLPRVEGASRIRLVGAGCLRAAFSCP